MLASKIGEDSFQCKTVDRRETVFRTMAGVQMEYRLVDGENGGENGMTRKRSAAKL
jgi:hypothetical protein